MLVYSTDFCYFCRMDYKDFLSRLQERTDKGDEETKRYMSALLHIVKEQCVQMDTVSIQGFGSFEPKKKLERVVTNPTTGKRMLIPPKMILTFKPGSVIKSKLKQLPPQ